MCEPSPRPYLCLGPCREALFDPPGVEGLSSMHFGMNPREETDVKITSTVKGWQQCNARICRALQQSITFYLTLRGPRSGKCNTLSPGITVGQNVVGSSCSWGLRNLCKCSLIKGYLALCICNCFWNSHLTLMLPLLTLTCSSCASSHRPILLF